MLTEWTSFPPTDETDLKWNGWLTSIWMGLATLVVLEIVLGIDNLVFIAILADKLPPHQRDRARVIGLALAAADAAGAAGGAGLDHEADRAAATCSTTASPGAT
jgi:hypothetical protein